MKQQEPLQDWEKELHRDLMELPELEAPPTLIPRVLDRISKPATQAWYQSPWWQWPSSLRWASAALVLAALGLLGWLGGTSGELGFSQTLVQGYVDVKATLSSGLATCGTVLGSGATFWSQYGQMILIAASALLLGTYLTCVAAGTALYQLAWRRSV